MLLLSLTAIFAVFLVTDAVPTPTNNKGMLKCWLLIVRFVFFLFDLTNVCVVLLLVKALVLFCCTVVRIDQPAGRAALYI